MPLYSGLGDCPNNLILSLPSPKRCLPPYIRTPRQLCSPKCLEGEFYELRPNGVLRSSLQEFIADSSLTD
jgi:hypothetical protein